MTSRPTRPTKAAYLIASFPGAGIAAYPVNASNQAKSRHANRRMKRAAASVPAAGPRQTHAPPVSGLSADVLCQRMRCLAGGAEANRHDLASPEPAGRPPVTMACRGADGVGPLPG